MMSLELFIAITASVFAFLAGTHARRLGDRLAELRDLDDELEIALEKLTD